MTRRSTWLALAVALGLFALANWYAHHPLAWQRESCSALPAPLSTFVIQASNAAAEFTDNLGLTGTDVEESYHGKLPTSGFKGIGLPIRTAGGVAPADLKLLTRSHYVAAWSPSLRHPLWVAYAATPYARAAADPEKRPSGFRADAEAPGSPASSEYRNSGFDRGHLAPNLAIAVRGGKNAQAQTFLTSNVCPQRPGLNQGPWAELEYRISEVWPERYGTVWAFVGAVPSQDRLHRTIDVPSAFWQVLLARDSGGTLRALAVLMPQNTARHAFARATVVSVREIEKISGLTFFPELPAAVRKALVNGTPSRLWPTGFGGFLQTLLRRWKSHHR